MGSHCSQGEDVVKYQNEKYPASTLLRISSSPPSMSLSSHWGAAMFPSVSGQDVPWLPSSWNSFLIPTNPMPTKRNQLLVLLFNGALRKPPLLSMIRLPSNTLSDLLFFFFRVSLYLLMTLIWLTDFCSLHYWNSVLHSVSTMSVLFTAHTYPWKFWHLTGCFWLWQLERFILSRGYEPFFRAHKVETCTAKGGRTFSSSYSQFPQWS